MSCRSFLSSRWFRFNISIMVSAAASLTNSARHRRSIGNGNGPCRRDNRVRCSWPRRSGRSLRTRKSPTTFPLHPQGRNSGTDSQVRSQDPGTCFADGNVRYGTFPVGRDSASARNRRTGRAEPLAEHRRPVAEYCSGTDRTAASPGLRGQANPPAPGALFSHGCLYASFRSLFNRLRRTRRVAASSSISSSIRASVPAAVAWSPLSMPR